MTDSVVNEGHMAKRKAAAKAKTASKKKKPMRGMDATRRSPRSQALPGMGKVRSQVLDNLCEGIADCRAAINASTGEESGLIQSAHQLMQKRNIATYRHARVELSRVPGAEKLRVRMTKEDGDSATTQGQEQQGPDADESNTDVSESEGEEQGEPGQGEPLGDEADQDATNVH